MPVHYTITRSGALYRSVKDLLADPIIKSEMKKTSAAFVAMTRRKTDREKTK